MKISKKTLATVLIGLASVIGVVSIFCFFGAADKLVASAENITESISGPSMFAAMLGGEWSYLGVTQNVKSVPGMTVLFVIEIIILLLSVVLIAGNVSKKLKENTTICIASIIALLTLVGVVMSFCTISICGDKVDVVIEGVSITTKLGAGAISYSVLGIVGIISNVAGIALAKKA